MLMSPYLVLLNIIWQFYLSCQVEWFLKTKSRQFSGRVILNGWSVENFFFEKMGSIIRSNSLRHTINYHSIVAFARYRSQKVYIFPGFDTIIPSPQSLLLEDIFSQQDEGVP